MITTVDISEKRIGEEVRAIQDAARKLPTTRQAALEFLRRIGADGWPNSPTKRNGHVESRSQRKKK